ncbi:MAG: hypothetical protein ACTHMM_21165 [Agriterribacter sp.]
MIVINKDSINNKIALSLRQFQTEECENFLFVFRNDFTNTSFTANLEDVSVSKERSNIFCVPGSLFEDELAGSWHFTVYQNPDDVEDPEGLRCVGRGMLIITETAEPIKVYSNERTTNSVYNG